MGQPVDLTYARVAVLQIIVQMRAVADLYRDKAPFLAGGFDDVARILHGLVQMDDVKAAVKKEMIQ